MNIPKKISVIIPCYNEAKYAHALVKNLLDQDYPKEKVEIIFADGMSTDSTKEILCDYAKVHSNFRVIDNQQRYVPTALNAAILKSTGEIVIRMDAHSIYPRNYWNVLVAKLEEHDADNVGGVWDTQPGADTDEARAIVLATTHPLGIGNASYRLGGKSDVEVDTVPFGCFRREIFDQVGLFDPQLIRNQDDEFNGRIIKGGGKIVLIPSLKIKYYARPTFRKLSTMFYQYGLFKPLVNIKLGAPATLRQFAPPIFVLGIFLGGILALLHTIFLYLWCSGLCFYLLAILLVSLRLTGFKKIHMLVLAACAFPVIHFSYGIGYIFGLIRYRLLRKHLKGNNHQVTSSR